MGFGERLYLCFAPCNRGWSFFGQASGPRLPLPPAPLQGTLAARPPKKTKNIDISLARLFFRARLLCRLLLCCCSFVLPVPSSVSVFSFLFVSVSLLCDHRSHDSLQAYGIPVGPLWGLF